MTGSRRPTRSASSFAVWRELWLAVRTLRRKPAIATVVIAVMALGIGGATLAAGVIDGIVLRPFPFPDPDRLVAIGVENVRRSEQLHFMENVSPPEFIDIRRLSTTLDRFYAFDAVPAAVRTGRGGEGVVRTLGWGDAFATLGVTPHLGRGFVESEMEPYGQGVAVISYRLWASQFGADSTLVGNPIEINQNPYVVVGIMPAGIRFHDADVWTPGGSPPATRSRGPRRQFQVVARIRSGRTLADVNRELGEIAASVAAANVALYPEYEGWTLRALTWTEANVRGYKRLGLLILGAVGFLLALICVNVSSIHLARAVERNRELAVMSALGAGRPRIFTLLLGESLVVSLAGGVLGGILAALGLAGVDALVTQLPDIHGQVRMSARLVAFAIGLSVTVGVASGLIPAVSFSRRALGQFLRANSGATASPGRLRTQHVLVAMEMALAVVLLAGTGVTVRAFLNLGRSDAGFDTTNLLAVRFNLPGGYEPEMVQRFYGDLERRVGELPGVAQAGVAFGFPPTSVLGYRPVAVDVQPEPDTPRRRAFMSYSSPAFGAVLGLRLISGRLLSDSDRAESPPVAVVNETFVQHFSPDRNPIGRRIRDLVEDDGPWFEIVGVTAPVRNQGLDADPAPEAYVNVRQTGGSKHALYLVVRTRGAARSVLPAVRGIAAELDPYVPVLDVGTVAERIAREGAPLRLGAATFLGLAVMALVLAAVGVGAVVAFAAAQRTREIGIRRALGARDNQLTWAMARATLFPAVAGCVVGVVGAVALGGVLPQPLAVQPPGLPVLAATAAILVGAAMTAAVLPARRASRLDPVDALRAE